MTREDLLKIFALPSLAALAIYGSFLLGQARVQAAWDIEKETIAQMAAQKQQENVKEEKRLTKSATNAGKDFKNAKGVIDAAYRNPDRLRLQGVCSPGGKAKDQDSKGSDGRTQANFVLPARTERSLFRLAREADTASEQLRSLQRVLLDSDQIEIIEEE